MAVDNIDTQELVPETTESGKKKYLITNFAALKSANLASSSGIFGALRNLANGTKINLESETNQMSDLTDKLSKLQSSTESQLKVPSELDISPFTPDSVSKTFEGPDRETYTTIAFESKTREGDELNPGKRMVFRIPEKFKGRVIRDIILKHRKDPSRFSGGDWDSDGAYSRVLVRDSQSGKWQGWVDPAGYGTDKFAEPRSAYDPENEVLHDWITTVGEVHPQVISVENVGKTDKAVSNVHGIEIVFFPEDKDVDYEEHIFSKGTQFVDIEKHRLEPRYGGGPSYGGKYPDAVSIGGYERDKKLSDTSKNMYLDEQGRLHIKIKPGKKFLNLELAVGDTHPDGVANKDGHIGTLGWAKIYAGLKLAGESQIVPFMENVNVPPAGVLAGGPQDESRTAQVGDEIIITSRADVSYLMGLRIAYKKD